jgi:mono/diheme cytochrome c family protein
MMQRDMRILMSGAAGALALTALLGGASTASAQTAPTFTKDVAPIFQQKCEACHRPESIAPMSLQTWQQSRPWARSIKARVLEHSMPPFQIDRTVGITKFKNDDSLTNQELDTIVKWVDAGAPQGDPKHMPEAIKWPTEQTWNFSKVLGKEPDLVVKSDSFTMPAVSQDAWDKRVTPIDLDEPRWVRAIEIRPGNLKGRKIVHHAIAYLEQDEPGAPQAGPAPLFMEWAVGKQGEMMRPDSGKLLMPGARFRWDIHYSQGGEEITSNVEMGIYFYEKGQEPKYRTRLSLIPAALGSLDLRPNVVTVTEGFYPLRENARIESFQPHMHLRGKAMMVEAILPTGQRQVLSHIDNFNFMWMTTFVYDDNLAPLLPKGTILKVTAWHDNTTAKKTNPDPSQWVGWGDRTVDEMAHAWMNIVNMNDEEFKAEVAKRKTATPTSEEREREQ